jgi:hypothetical protein
VAVSAAVVVEPPVPAVVDLAHLPVLALAQVVAPVVVEPAVPLELLLSRQSFSAAMARSPPSPAATYEPVPRSR